MPKNIIQSSSTGPQQVGASHLEASQFSLNSSFSSEQIQSDLMDAIEVGDTLEMAQLAEKHPAEAAHVCFKLLQVETAAGSLNSLLRMQEVRESVRELFKSQSSYPEDDRKKMVDFMLSHGYYIKDSLNFSIEIQGKLKQRYDDAISFYGYKNYKHGIGKTESVYIQSDQKLIRSTELKPVRIVRNLKPFVVDSVEKYKTYLKEFSEKNNRFPMRPHVFANQKYGAGTFGINGVHKIDPSDGTQVVCRHFSGAYIKAYDQGNHKELLKEMRDGKLPLSFTSIGALEKSFDELRFSRSVVVDNQHFGKFLFDFQNQMVVGEKHALLMASPYSSSASGCGHALALTIEKVIENNQVMVKVGVYDPNMTANQATVERLPEHLDRLKIDDMLRLKGAELHLCEGALTVAGPKLGTVLGNDKLRSQYVDESREAQISHLPMALMMGSEGYVKDVMASIEKQHGGIPSQVSQDLEAVLATVKHNVSLVQYCLTTKGENSVHALRALLSKANFNANQLTNILTEKWPRSTKSAIWANMSRGAENSVRAYGQMLKELPLTDLERKNILRKVVSAPLNTAELAHYDNSANAVQAFLDILKENNLTPADVGFPQNLLTYLNLPLQQAVTTP